MLVQYSIRNNSQIVELLEYEVSLQFHTLSIIIACVQMKYMHAHTCFLHMYWWTPILSSRIVRKMNWIEFLYGKYIKSNSNNEMRGERKRKQFRFLSFLPFYFYCLVNVCTRKCGCMWLLTTSFDICTIDASANPIQISNAEVY